MGGVAGVAFSGPNCAETVRGMGFDMPYRATDGTSEACSRSAHILGLYRRPHLEYPQLPPNVRVADHVLVASDSRIDNRDELLAQLGMPGASDNDLIHAAWIRWGDGFPEKLIGDFVFAIYREDTERLILGRDPTGVKPLFYAWTCQGFAFSSEIAPIARLLQKQTVNDGHVRSFLLGKTSDSNETMIAGIFRVPPGHTLEIDRNRNTEFKRYWDPHSISVSSETSPSRLWDLLCNSVHQRSKSTGRVGFACSGGLDSTSICYAAASCKLDAILPLRTFSIVFDKTPAESERRYIESALNDLPADATFVDMSGYDPLDDLAEHLSEQARLFHAPGLAMNGKLYHHVKAAGCEVFIDGHGGDEVISHGFQRLAELAREKRWLELWRNTAAASHTFGASRHRTFLTYWLRHGTHRLPRIRRRLMRSLWPTSSSEDILGPTLRAIASQAEQTSVNTCTSKNASHIASIFNSAVTDSLEVIELAAARRGIEIRFPFFDRRLIEYALSLPEEAKLQGRWTRAALRDATKNIVPDSIRLRTEKFDFTSHLARGILQSSDNTMDELLQEKRLADLINIAFIKRAWLNLRTARSKSKNTDTVSVWRAITLAKWNKLFTKGDGF